MVLPKDLQQKIELQLKNYKRKELERAATSLSEAYLKKEWQLSHVECLAYLATRLPATWAVQQKLLPPLLERFPVSTLLDFGAGPGTVSFACDIPNILHVETEKHFVELGKAIGSRGTWTNRLPQVSYGGTLCSYSFGEVAPLEREALLKKLWKLSDKWILIIEPGTPEGYHTILSLREALIELGGTVVAPCPHNNPCPMKEPKWCHFPVHVERTSLHKQLKGGTLGYEQEKYSYVFVTKEAASPEGPRIVDTPKGRARHILFNVCHEGGISQKILSKRHGELYQKAKRLKWGDAIELPPPKFEKAD
jgi:ribosomal protein RSM22 (predicted rRNA methylase)